MSGRKRIANLAAAGIAAIAVATAIALLLILPSRWFEQKLRERALSDIERVTGGRADIGAFSFDWEHLTLHVSRFVLHGTEPAGAAPLFSAENIDIGLKIVSLVKRDIDIASLRVSRPRVNLIVSKNGITNLPRPRIPRAGPIEDLLSLEIQTISLDSGIVQFAERQIPVDVHGENFEARLKYELAGPRYRGRVRFERLRLATPAAGPLTFAFDGQIALEKNRLGIERARLSSGRSNAEISGAVTDFKDPAAAFQVRVQGDLAELGSELRLPPPHVGTVSFTGTATYNATSSYTLAGTVAGRGLGFDQDNVRIRNVSLESRVQAGRAGVVLRGLVVKALDGSFTGAVEVGEEFRTVKINGLLNGISVGELARAAGMRNVPWDGRASGPVEVVRRTGRPGDLKAAGSLDIAAATSGPPVAGRIEFKYDQRAGSLELGKSYLNTPASRLGLDGAIGRQLQVRVETRNLNELVPLAALAGAKGLERLPVQINPGGAVTFEGTVTGPSQSAQVSGVLRGSNARVEGETIDSITAEIRADSSAAHVSNIAIVQGATTVKGNVDIGLRDWSPLDTAPLAGRVSIQNAPAATLLARAGARLPVGGTIDATLDLGGTPRNPAANGHVSVANPTVYGERLDRFTANVKYGGGAAEISGGVGQLGAARILVSGRYAHADGDWKNGHAQFDVSTSTLPLAQVRHVQELRPGARGTLYFAANGEAAVNKGEILLQQLTGRAAIRQLVVGGMPIGNLAIGAKTAGRELTLALTGDLRGSAVRGQGVVELSGDYPSRGGVTFAPMDLRTMIDLARSGGAAPMEAPPFEATTRGQITFAGPARRPQLITARLELPELSLSPTERQRTRTQQHDLTLRNEGAVVAEMDPSGIHVRSARFVGPDTNITLTGTVNYMAKTAWDLKVNGNVNLAVLSDFNSDIISSGGATVAAAVRGTLRDPQLEGSLQLKNASFYVTDFPNGLDQANGTISFDRNRATIRRLTGSTGGGQVTLGGFVGYGTGEWTYRLNARADGVRIRYPEGVSFTANGIVALNGTSSRSLASGTITVLRAGFNPRTDIGGLLVASANPVETPTAPNEMLRNLQLDVRVETVPNLTFQTSLTQDLQAEADLRIRGTAAKPSVLGHITINQGDIQFFGNTYTITRGEISFNNPVRIEPVVDLDLETRVRGIIVDINFAGPISKLNVGYRSDPPLQSAEIIALLAVGRTPGETTGIAASQVTQNQGALSTNTNNLLGQAMSAPVSNRLQRFFGVSRVKIDPSLQTLDAVPQARLTLEQQISKDVTLTYITNLSNTNQQIVQVQWDLNKKWSVLATRDENGLFGIDFLYKRRFR